MHAMIEIIPTDAATLLHMDVVLCVCTLLDFVAQTACLHDAACNMYARL